MDRHERKTVCSPRSTAVRTCTIAIIFVLQLAVVAVAGEILQPQPDRVAPAPKPPLEGPELWGARAERFEQILTNCVLKTARRLAEHDAHMPAPGIVETAFDHCAAEETVLRLHIVTGLSSLSPSAHEEILRFRERAIRQCALGDVERILDHKPPICAIYPDPLDSK